MDFCSELLYSFSNFHFHNPLQPTTIHVDLLNKYILQVFQKEGSADNFDFEQYVYPICNS